LKRSIALDPDLKDFVIVDRDENEQNRKNNGFINNNSNSNQKNEKENDNEEVETKNEEEENDEITISNSSRMIPIIRDKINEVYSMDDNVDESQINSLHDDLLKYKVRFRYFCNYLFIYVCMYQFVYIYISLIRVYIL
jgi:hypothetical protein